MSGSPCHASGEAPALARTLVDLSRAMHCAIEAGDYDQLPGYVDERQRVLDRLLARRVDSDAAEVRTALEAALELDRTTAAFLAAEVEAIRRELEQLPAWRRTLESYRPARSVGPRHLDREG